MIENDFGKQYYTSISTGVAKYIQDKMIDLSNDVLNHKEFKELLDKKINLQNGIAEIKKYINYLDNKYKQLHYYESLNDITLNNGV